jgi:hypothetical protein
MSGSTDLAGGTLDSSDGAKIVVLSWNGVDLNTARKVAAIDLSDVGREIFDVLIV